MKYDAKKASLILLFSLISLPVFPQKYSYQALNISIVEVQKKTEGGYRPVKNLENAGYYRLKLRFKNNNCSTSPTSKCVNSYGRPIGNIQVFFEISSALWGRDRVKVFHKDEFFTGNRSYQRLKAQESEDKYSSRFWHSGAPISSKKFNVRISASFDEFKGPKDYASSDRRSGQAPPFYRAFGRDKSPKGILNPSY